VLTVTIDRPPVNALDYPLIAEIHGAFASVDADPGIGAVVLTATGTRAFSAGKDLSENEGPLPLAVRADSGRRSRSMLESIRDCPVPVVAALSGPAIGGGMSIVAMCDCVVAVRGAWIQTPEVNVGLLGAFAHLASIVGPRRARYLYLSAQRCSAQELYDMGAVVRLAEPEELLAVANEIARDFAIKSPAAIRLAKEVMERIDGMPMRDAYRTEQDYTRRLAALCHRDEGR
jgi:enoyl-CoA hydratase